MTATPRSVSLLLALFAGTLAAADLQPFRMPWNDASPGLTSLQAWQPAAAGDEGWVNVTPEGRYQVNARPIRFLGVNVTSADCFPSHDNADGHAARLAKFGFNAVRFHHMEAPWDKANVLVDYAAGNSRTLSPARLDRLHYFIAQLAAHGIYTNINLLVSREFQPADGLGPEIAQLGWKDQHVLGFFMDEALSLHREYATQLLTAPNPHRGGRTLADDPAVAFVEIMNENGLLQKWYEGVLDTLPAPYRQALQTKWNVWLKTRYASTSALLTAWGATDQPLGPNRLLNGNFASGAASWNLERHGGAVASATATADFTGGAPSLRIDVTTAGAANWHVQFIQGNLSLEAGKTYTLSFSAKAAAATPLSATLTRTGPSDYSAVHPSLSATLGTTWQRYTTTFQASATEPSVRLVFNGFGDRLATVTLADVVFQEGGTMGALPAGTSLEAGTIPNVLRNPTSGHATAGQLRDWIAYVFAAEKTYWDTMYAHIKHTLGYRGIVWATIVSNSPPNPQIAMDAMDSHSYWQHPQFLAGLDWDPDLWTVGNVSMVNSPASNTLTGIARQRVEGVPHNVTEYQHSSPNTYASETPLLAAAYGALQDWDSLWMFEYKTGPSEYVTGHFDHGGHAGKMANNLIAAALFRRGDVAPANLAYILPLTPAKEIELARTRGGAWSIADGAQLDVPGNLAFQSRLSLSIGDDATGLVQPPAAPAGDIIISDTSELRWDTSLPGKGIVTVDTARSKAVIGFTGARTFDLGGVRIAPGPTRQDWNTIALTLLEGLAFTHASGGRGVIVATGDQENTGQVWKDASRTSVGTRWGSAPTLIEVVPATITLPVSPARVTAWALDATGSRASALVIRDHGGLAQFDLGQNGATLWYEFAIEPEGSAEPAFTREPSAVTAAAGMSATLTVDVDAAPAPTLAWTRNGSALAGETAPSLTFANLQPADTGLYRAFATNAAGTSTSELAILGVTSGEKVIGDGRELTPTDIVHPNGNVFDQVLLTGVAEAITADYAQGQVTRTSFIDLDGDIVQVEFSGPGTLALVLENATDPAPPVLYHQPNVSYMKGHAGIVITGADERTNVSVFTVGRATAVDPSGSFNLLQPISATNDPANNGSPLFEGHANTAYDGIADLAFIAISSTNGRFGGVRTSNAHYFAAKGLTGLYAPGVTFLGPVFVGDIVADAEATPALLLGSAADVRITGGDLLQANGAAVQVRGFTQLKFTAGSDSHGHSLPAQANRAIYIRDGVDVTAQLVTNPAP